MKLDMSQELFAYNCAGTHRQPIQPLTMKNKIQMNFWTYVQGRLRVPRAGGKASSEGTSMFMYVPPQG